MVTSYRTKTTNVNVSSITNHRHFVGIAIATRDNTPSNLNVKLF